MRCMKMGFVSLLLVLGLAAQAFAAKGDKELDFTLGIATAPYGAYDSGWGMNFGAGYEFMDNMTPQISGDSLQIRGDIGYHAWSGNYGYLGADHTLHNSRIPIAGSCRYYFPIKPVRGLRVFGQAGLEISLDSWDDGRQGVKYGHDEVNIGVTPGGGVEYHLNRDIFVTAVMKEHIVSDSYFTLQGGFGFRF